MAQLFNYLTVPLMILAAVSLDRMFGEPRRFHPLAGFGDLAKRIETMSYGTENTATAMRYARGIAAVCALLIPLIALAFFLQQLAFFGTLCQIAETR